LKRKTPDTESSYSSETDSVLDLDDDPTIYNGTLRYRDDFVTIKVCCLLWCCDDVSNLYVASLTGKARAAN